MHPTPSTQRGNVIFIILIAVALFAALGFAVSQRSNVSVESEQAKIAQIESEQCQLAVSTAVKKLRRLKNCPPAQISYELPDGSNENAQNPSDTSCFVFHANGGGLTACGIYTETACNLTALAVGEKCLNDDIVYAGMVGGARIYAALTDSGAAIRYSNGDEASYVVSGASSMTDGFSNTNTLVTTPPPVGVYEAATLCRSLGSEWYLPARDELVLLYNVRNTGSFTGSFTEGDAVDHHWYLSSTESTQYAAYMVRFFTGQVRSDANKVYSALHIRCVRRD